MKVERQRQTTISRSPEFCEGSVTLTLMSTPLPVEHFRQRQEDHPIFYIPLMLGDSRLMNNLELTVEEVCTETGSAKLTFKQSEYHSEGTRRLAVDDLAEKDGIIQIGAAGEIVLRKVNSDGRLGLYMSLAKDIDVHSKEYLLQISPDS